VELAFRGEIVFGAHKIIREGTPRAMIWIAEKHSNLELVPRTVASDRWRRHFESSNLPVEN
jgi:hypothetical protein